MQPTSEFERRVMVLLRDVLGRPNRRRVASVPGITHSLNTRPKRQHSVCRSTGGAQTYEGLPGGYPGDARDAVPSF